MDQDNSKNEQEVPEFLHTDRIKSRHKHPNQPQTPSASDFLQAEDAAALGSNPYPHQAGLDTPSMAQSRKDQSPETTETIQKLNDELANTKEQLLRTLAENENIRRRTQKEVEEASKYGMTSFARDMINVLENLHRAEESIAKDELTEGTSIHQIFQGVEMTKRELLSIFERHGIKRISPENEPFDHNFHQAMMHVVTKDQPPGTVVQVLQAGYVIKDRLLRPALVSVSKSED